MTVAGMRWCLGKMGRYVVMQQDMMKEEVMVAGKLVCFMSPECLTHTWYCRGAVRIVAHVSVWRILARRVRDHMVLQRSCKDSGSRVGYDRNRIIRPEPEPEPEFRFRFAGTGFGNLNSGSGIKNRNWHLGIPVPVQKNRN